MSIFGAATESVTVQVADDDQTGDPARRPPRLRQLLRVPAFAALYTAEVQSVAGDQLARVALSVLVFEHTNNAAATALTYAATFLPAVFGGFALGGAGDRYPRRAVLVTCDLCASRPSRRWRCPPCRCLRVIALLVVAIFVGPAHTAAQVSYLAQALSRRAVPGRDGNPPGDESGGAGHRLRPRRRRRRDHRSARGTAGRRGHVRAGSRAEGRLPARRCRDRRPGCGAGRRCAVRHEASGCSRLRQDRMLRTAIGLCWLQGFFVVPEGLAVPFAGALGVGTTSAGLLLAALPFGGAVGAVLVTRHVRAAARRPVSRAMAVATGLPLVLSALHLPLPAVLLAWTVSGAMSAYLLEVMSEIVQAVPAESRARVVGRISAGLVTAQGVGLAVFGVLAQAGGVRAAVGWAGGVGVLIAAALTLGERRPRRSTAARAEDGGRAGSTDGSVREPADGATAERTVRGAVAARAGGVRSAAAGSTAGRRDPAGDRDAGRRSRRPVHRLRSELPVGGHGLALLSASVEARWAGRSRGAGGVGRAGLRTPSWRSWRCLPLAVVGRCAVVRAVLELPVGGHGGCPSLVGVRQRAEGPVVTGSAQNSQFAVMFASCSRRRDAVARRGGIMGLRGAKRSCRPSADGTGAQRRRFAAGRGSCVVRR